MLLLNWLLMIFVAVCTAVNAAMFVKTILRFGRQRPIHNDARDRVAFLAIRRAARNESVFVFIQGTILLISIDTVAGSHLYYARPNVLNLIVRVLVSGLLAVCTMLDLRDRNLVAKELDKLQARAVESAESPADRT